MTLLICCSGEAFSTEKQLVTYFQNNSPPRYFQSNKMNTGICIDVINEINHRLEATKITIINPNQIEVPMKRIMQYIELDQDIDLFVGAAKTQGRVDHIGQYSIALFPIRGTFAKNRTNNFLFTGKDSLKGLTIGVLRGSSSVELMNNIIGVNPVQTNTIEQSLKMLEAGRLDLVYYHSLGLRWQIGELNLRNVIELIDEHEYLEEGHQYIIYASHVPKEIISKVDKVIEAMRADGSMDYIVNKYQ